jgi:hypothetical protein
MLSICVAWILNLCQAWWPLGARNLNCVPSVSHRCLRPKCPAYALPISYFSLFIPCYRIKRDELPFTTVSSSSIVKLNPPPLHTHKMFLFRHITINIGIKGTGRTLSSSTSIVGFISMPKLCPSIMLKKVSSSTLHNQRREKICKSANFREKTNDPQHRNNIVNIKQLVDNRMML